MSVKQIKNSQHENDPQSLKSGEEYNRLESICAECFNVIFQPLLSGIWYHADKYTKYTHSPNTASILHQLFFFLLKPSYIKFEKSKKCKCLKHWNNFLGFKKLDEGFYHSHYYLSNHVSLCGRLMPLEMRENIPKKYYASSEGFDSCKKCIGKLEKLGFVELYDYHSYTNSSKVRWLKKDKIEIESK